MNKLVSLERRYLLTGNDRLVTFSDDTEIEYLLFVNIFYNIYVSLDKYI